jgi:hypothetical protein
MTSGGRCRLVFGHDGRITDHRIHRDHATPRVSMEGIHEGKWLRR